MRLFLAIDVNDDVRRRATEIARHLSDGHPAAARGLRWVRSDQLHLTLRFLGEVPSPLADRVVEACQGAIDRPAFDIAFGGVAWLPHAGSPRVLMLPVVEGLEPLRGLKAAVDARLPPGVPEEEPRPFTPHLTLARVRDDFRREARALARGPAVAPAHAVASGVQRVLLIESRLSQGGPDYQVRGRLELDAGDAR